MSNIERTLLSALLTAGAMTILGCVALALMGGARAGIVSDCERMGSTRVGDAVVACQVVRK